MDKHRLLFIGGLHRSGTSILHRCLREHPSISGFRNTSAPEDEGQHLQTVYPPAKDFGGPGRFGFDGRAHLTDQSPLVNRENAARLFEQWSRYWDLSKPVLVEKSPPNLIRMRFLHALFPDARFGVIMRHPVAVAYSTQAWRPGLSLDALIHHWVHCHNIFEEDLARIHSDAAVTTLRYEDFVASPDEILDSFLKPMDLPPVGQTSQVVRTVNDKHLARWAEAPESTRAPIIERYDRAVTRYGYSLAELQPHGVG